MNEFVLPGLVKRRAELAGDLEKAQARIQQLYADLASLDAVIRQLDPDYPVGAIQAKRRRDSAGEEFAAMSRTVLGALRSAGRPLTTPAIAERVIVDRGLDAEKLAGAKQHGRLRGAGAAALTGEGLGAGNGPVRR